MVNFFLCTLVRNGGVFIFKHKDLNRGPVRTQKVDMGQGVKSMDTFKGFISFPWIFFLLRLSFHIVF